MHQVDSSGSQDPYPCFPLSKGAVASVYYIIVSFLVLAQLEAGDTVGS